MPDYINPDDEDYSWTEYKPNIVDPRSIPLIPPGTNSADIQRIIDEKRKKEQPDQRPQLPLPQPEERQGPRKDKRDLESMM